MLITEIEQRQKCDGCTISIQLRCHRSLS